jgi:hypothetical protein
MKNSIKLGNFTIKPGNLVKIIAESGYETINSEYVFFASVPSDLYGRNLSNIMEQWREKQFININIGVPQGTPMVYLDTCVYKDSATYSLPLRWYLFLAPTCGLICTYLSNERIVPVL